VWLDLNGAANHCALSVRTLRRYLGDPAHPLPAYIVGGKVLIDRDEVDEWIRGFPRHGQASVIIEEMLRGIGQEKRRPQG
jgi:excisionase family DNA binding protein